jgi:tetratricopeptide (TPR) repeat protein
MKISVKILSLAAALLLGPGLLSSQADTPLKNKCEQKWGPDSVKTIQNISVYREFFKQKNYEAAMEPWRYVYNNAPCAREQTHLDGVAMYKAMIAKEKDPKRKALLVDTIFAIYDTRSDNFPENAGSITGRKAIDMLNYRPEPNSLVLSTFKRSVKLGGNNTEYFVISYYFKVALKEFAAGNINKEQVIEIYESLDKIIQANMGGNLSDKYAEAKQSIDADLAGNIIKDCDEIIALFDAKYKADPNNKELRDLLFSLLLSKGCTGKDIFVQVAEAKYKETPTATLALVLGRKYRDSDAAQSAKYYEAAISQAENDSVKAQYTFELAGMYSANNQFSKARTTALEAARLQPKWGKPYIFIGDLYASSSRQCGSGIESQSVFWAAVDKYQYARSIDPSVADEANKKIGQYAGYFPRSEDLFFNNIAKGSSYKVGCWIGETTTVRASD